MACSFVAFVAVSSEQKTGPKGLRLKIAKHSHGRFSTRNPATGHDSIHNEGSSASVQFADIINLSNQLTADGTRDVVPVLEKNERVSLARSRLNDNQPTFGLKVGKQITDGSSKSADEQKQPVVLLGENLNGKKFGAEKRDDADDYFHGTNLDGQLGKRSSVEKKEDAGDYAHGSAMVMKGYKKTERRGTQQLDPRRRSASDVSSSDQHSQDQPGTEQKSRNGDQLVPPLKIRLDQQQRGKSADQQAVAAAECSLSGSGSENTRDDVDVDRGATDKTDEKKYTESMAPNTHAAASDGRTERDAVQRKDDTATCSTSSDQRRTRTTSATTRPGPAVTKRRLSFEESLIAGTCISITSNLATDSAKTSAANEATHSIKESAGPTAKPVADSKPVLNIPTKKDLGSTKRVKLDDKKSLSLSTTSGTKKASDEATVKLRSSHHTAAEDGSDNAKASGHAAQDSQSNPTETKLMAVRSEVSEHDSVSIGDGKSKAVGSGDAGTSRSKVPGCVKSSLASEASQSHQSTKQSSSQRTSRYDRHHHRRHPGSSVKLHQMAGTSLDYELRQSRSGNTKFRSLIHIETQPNGGASVVHAYDDELSILSPREFGEFVGEFFRIVFDEDPVGVPRHVMGIVHNSAAYLPDILEYFAGAHPDMVVKRNHLGKSSDVETTTIGEYHQLVRSTYLAGTYRTGPLDHFSIVGTKAEETGGYFPAFLDLLEQNEFLKYVSPWGKLSELENMPRNHSNDGPIVWARPGEQVVPTADMPKSPAVKKR